MSIGEAERPGVRAGAGPGSPSSAREPHAPPPESDATAGDPPPGPAGEAWLLMRQLFVSQRPALTAIARDLELAPPAALALHHLDPDRPVTMGELAQALCYDNSNVTGIVDRLEGQGYVERRPDPRDRRAKLVRVTAAGAEARRRLIARMAEPPPPLAHLSERDQVALRDVLRRALAA